MFIAIVYFPGCDVMNFEINLTSFSDRLVFSTWPKIKDKNLNILRPKTTFKMKKQFSSFLKGSFNEVNNTNFFGGEKSDFKDTPGKKHP